MTLKPQPGKAIRNTISGSRRSVILPEEARILIVSDDASITVPLTNAFRIAGLVVDCVTSLAEGCEFARSGRFQVVFTALSPGNRSWKRLVEISRRYSLGFMVVLLARNFDVYQWAEALKDGAFDVLDPFYELPRAAEAAKRALWAASQKAPSPIMKRPPSRTPHKC